MKTKLQLELATVAPSICIETLWERDHDPVWIADGPDLSDEMDCWQSEVRVSAIVRGELVTGSDYLGGTWEQAGNHPAASNPTISGYELQMTEAALEELRPKLVGVAMDIQIRAALTLVRVNAEQEYAAQHVAV